MTRANSETASLVEKVGSGIQFVSDMNYSCRVARKNLGKCEATHFSSLCLDQTL